jgi:hypothetical protein
MSAISRCSSALLVRAGIKITILSPSRCAETVRLRRALRRTSIGGGGVAMHVTLGRDGDNTAEVR